MEGEIKIGVSSCLLGQSVRHNGGHTRSAFVTEMLGKYVSFVPKCPEMDIGLGVPREAIRLSRTRKDAAVQLIGTKSGDNHTAAMTRYAEETAAWLKDQDLCGYIFKKDSPSCGLFRVKIYDFNNRAERNGIGMFAKHVVEALPGLPMEEEGRLHDALLRENFVARIFAYRRVKDLFAPNWTLRELIDFHRREKMLLMAHNQTAYRRLGQLVAGAKDRDRGEVARQYIEEFMAALSRPVSIGRHVNVLQHMAGYVSKFLDDAGREDLQGAIKDYQDALVPLSVPLVLCRHLVRRFAVSYLLDQSYLSPHPKEMALRNYI